MDDLIAPDAVFAILDGVHRCVGVREAGLGGVLAKIYRDGHPPLVRLIDLDRLYCSKPSVGRWDKGRDVLDLARRLSTPAGRSEFEEVTVIQISPATAARMTRLVDVSIEDGGD